MRPTLTHRFCVFSHRAGNGVRTHFMMDLGVGIALIALPFIAGFGDDGGAARFFVIAGVLELGTALMTRWDQRRR